MTNEKIIVCIDDEDVLELAPEYLESRRGELSKLRDAILKQDFAFLRSYGHNLKGSGGGYGFERISEIGGKMESAAKVQDLSAIEQELVQLQNYLERVEIVGV